MLVLAVLQQGMECLGLGACRVVSASARQLSQLLLPAHSHVHACCCATPIAHGKNELVGAGSAWVNKAVVCMRMPVVVPCGRKLGRGRGTPAVCTWAAVLGRAQGRTVAAYVVLVLSCFWQRLPCRRCSSPHLQITPLYFMHHMCCELLEQ
ncbi:hypothetical protein COO60DRAFT_20970 [Scenedesmus sp. NREL 46B-D3]|nr:hypothetical protein COO60DRAFT_20970 [Scenedesmus sp. NREL 46B-D3]